MTALPKPAEDRSSPARPSSAAASRRILSNARVLLFSRGYSAFTMDELATSLGMSKKTLYVHFSGKNEMIRAVIDGFAEEARIDAETLLADPALPFAEKLHGFARGMTARLSKIGPLLLVDLERNAPRLHQHVLQVRARTLPYIFGRFIEAGRSCGAIRDDADPVFAGEFFLHAMQGLLRADTLKRLRVRPEICFHHAVRLFFGGLLTPSGHTEYEKLFPR